MGKFLNIDYLGLGYEKSPMADFLFDCLFKSQESFSKFSNLTRPFKFVTLRFIKQRSYLNCRYIIVRYTRESLPLHPPIRRIFSFNINK
jgi:hypothetical protein